MSHLSTLLSIFIVFSISGLLILTGLIRRPGIGILGALLLIPLVMWLRADGPRDLGLQFPTNWSSSILRALLYAVVLSVLSWVVIEPLSEALTGTAHDYGPVGGIKGSWQALAQSLLFVWLFVAVAEEVIFRGFLMNEIFKFVGTGFAATILSVLATSVVFGLCHAYQNQAGIVTTGFFGLMFAAIYLVSGKNLWTAIFTHAFVDTIGLVAIYFGADRYLRNFIWQS